MGSVKRDIYVKERQWEFSNLSTVESIKGLLKKRSEFDSLLGLGNNFYNVYSSYVHLNEAPEEVICLYVTLDDIIKSIGLNDRQLKLLKAYQYGYTENDLAQKFNTSQQNINIIIHKICLKIKKENDSRWMNEFVLWDKKLVDSNYKQCKKCKEYFPTELFGARSGTQDNLQYFCKQCDTLRKKLVE
jgi:hypothetical protein